MYDDTVMTVMPVMRTINGDMMTRYPVLFWREVCYRFAIQTGMQVVRCVLKVCAETWVIRHKDE